MKAGLFNSTQLIVCFFLLTSNLVFAQKKIKVNEQVWMSKNLIVSKFRNGDPIPEAKTKEEWLNAGLNAKPAWCYFDNKKENGKKYGKLYNWYAMNDSRGLAPEGWRIPTEADWEILTDYIDRFNLINKEKNKFIAYLLLGGTRTSSGAFDYFGKMGFWWSATAHISTISWYHYLLPSSFNLHPDHINKSEGFSVICIAAK